MGASHAWNSVIVVAAFLFLEIWCNIFAHSCQYCIAPHYCYHSSPSYLQLTLTLTIPSWHWTEWQFSEWATINVSKINNNQWKEMTALHLSHAKDLLFQKSTRISTVNPPVMQFTCHSRSEGYGMIYDYDDINDNTLFFENFTLPVQFRSTSDFISVSEINIHWTKSPNCEFIHLPRIKL